MDLNKVMIIGNVVRDPETKTIPSGQNVSTLSIATNKVWKDKDSGEKKEKAEFHNLVAWRKLSDVIAQYVKKGQKVYVEGELQTRSWDDPNGVKKYRTEIVVSNLIMLDRLSNTEVSADIATKPIEKKEEEIDIDSIPF